MVTNYISKPLRDPRLTLLGGEAVTYRNSVKKIYNSARSFNNPPVRVGG
ncbi:MAG: hypothetical protein WKI04_07125 [Ferruginibacter sp.]